MPLAARVMTPRCSHKLPDQLQFRDADVHSDRSAKRNGAVFIWDSWQASGAHTVSAAGVVPASWHIANAGDFDSNRHADILWRNNNGAASIWDNGQIGNAHIIANAGVIPTSWHIAGVGDFGGNGHADILWHNDNGAVSIWDNGQTANAHVIANAGVQSSWHIV